MNIGSIILFFCIWPVLMQGKDPPDVDSLKAHLSSNLQDSGRFEVMLQLHQELIKSDTTESLQYLRQAIKLSKDNKHFDLYAQAQLKMSNFQWKHAHIPAAENALLQVEEILPQVTLPKVQATFFMEKGIVHYQKGEYDGAASEFMQASELYKQMQDILGEIKCYQNIGVCYWELEKHDDALKYYLVAMDLQKQTSDEVTLSRIYGNIGLVYRAKGNNQQALEYYLQSLEINRKNGYDRDATINLQNIGALYSKMEDYKKAEQSFADAKQLAEKNNDQRSILYANHGLATVLAKTGDYNGSIRELKAALAMAESLQSKEEIKNIYQSFAEIYEQAKDYRIALDYRKTFEVWKDSLISENHLSRIKDLELKYETAEKNKAIAQLEIQNTEQQAAAERDALLRNILLAGIAMLILIALLVVYALYQRLRTQKLLAQKNEELKASEYKQELSDLELKVIKSQMNPHFVFNCLNSINNMILNGDTVNASTYLTKFSGVMRKVLENSEVQWVTLNDELAVLENYLRLEGLRFKEKVKIHFDINPDLDLENTMIPPMIIQPLLENAIWHGLMHKEDGGEIKLQIKEQDHYLQCIIEDSGIGLEAAKAIKTTSTEKSSSFGLQLIKKRLKLLNQEEMEKLLTVTEIKDSNGQVLGTRVNISIPTLQPA